MINDFHGKYFFLSNFSESPLWYDGKLWPTVEHAFQAAKVDSETAGKIIVAKTPGEAKRLGRSGKMCPIWNDIRVNVMRECLKRKFLCNDELLQKLLETGDEELIEGNTWHDNYWGNCTCPKCENKHGENMLGKLLMEIRDKARRGMYVWAIKVERSYGNMPIEGYFKNRVDAEMELANMKDIFSDDPCKPDDNHLIIIELK